jgi:hypothetical protein
MQMRVVMKRIPLLLLLLLLLVVPDLVADLCYARAASGCHRCRFHAPSVGVHVDDRRKT